MNAERFEISDADLIPLENFSLKWRWTEDRYKKLPSSVLSRINPLTEEKASELYDFQKRFAPFEDFQYEKPRDENYVRTDFFSISTVTKWLENKIGKEEKFIFLCWNRNWAIRTTAEVFCDYWKEFCYPASDDIVISPEIVNWIIVYHHEEYLFFEKIRERKLTG